MKTWITTLTIPILALALAGCGGDGKRDKPAPVDVSKNDKKPDDKDVTKKAAQPKDNAGKDAQPKDVAKKDSITKKDGGPEKPKHTPPKPLEPMGEVSQLSSVAYGEVFKGDPDTATKVYNKKFVELTGRVTHIALSSQGKPLLFLEGAKGALVGIQCATRDSKPWLSALPGQTAKIRGIGTSSAVLEQCDILEAKGAEPPPFRADDLAQLFDLEETGTKTKFKQKWLFVEGEVAKVEYDKEDETAQIILKTDKPMPVVFLRISDAIEAKRVSGFKPGQRIKGLGEFSSGNERVGIHSVLVVEPTP